MTLQPLPAGLASGIDPRAMPNWLAPMWRAALDHRLVVARCAACRTDRVPPTPFCGQCGDDNIEWVELTGEATLHSFTIVRHPADAALASYVPYVVAVVDLDGSSEARLVTNIVGCDPSQIAIGDRLEVFWHEVSAEVVLALFHPTKADVR